MNAAPEKETLLAFLDYNREVVIDKCRGLTKEQLATKLAPSSLTLIGIVHHLALVELDWFVGDIEDGPLGEPWESVDWKADPDWEFDSAVDMDPEEVIAVYVERSGEQILVAPKARGFNLLAWLGPFFLLAVALLGMSLLVRRWSRQRVVAATAGAPSVEPDDPYMNRLREELRELE